jgi:hypothetical protein
MTSHLPERTIPLEPISDMRLDELRAWSHLPQVQDQIRQEVAKQTIRIIPAPGGGISIVRNYPPQGEFPAASIASSHYNAKHRGAVLNRKEPETRPTWHRRIEPRS